MITFLRWFWLSCDLYVIKETNPNWQEAQLHKKFPNSPLAICFRISVVVQMLKSLTACFSALRHTDEYCSVKLFCSFLSAFDLMQWGFFCFPWGLILSQITLAFKYQLLKVSRNFTFCQFKSYSLSALNPKCACGSTLSYLFLKAAYGGKPTWFPFVESFWSTKRGSLEATRIVELSSGRGLCPRPSLWTALISGFQRDGVTGRFQATTVCFKSGKGPERDSNTSPIKTSLSILQCNMYFLHSLELATFTFMSYIASQVL